MLDKSVNDFVHSNLEGLHDFEEVIRAQSIDLVKANIEYHDWYSMIGYALDAIHVLSIKHVNLNEDEYTIQLLGIRAFNNGATALKLFMSGYYQRALDIIRDSIELGFLLDYLHTYPEQIKKWRGSSDKERKTQYSSIRLREHLDKRDGLIDQKRHRIYSLFSELASHPTHKGFRLIVPAESNLHTIGAFKDEKLLAACLFELATHKCYVAAILILHFKNVSNEIIQLMVTFDDYGLEWCQRNNLEGLYRDK